MIAPIFIENRDAKPDASRSIVNIPRFAAPSVRPNLLQIAKKNVAHLEMQ